MMIRIDVYDDGPMIREGTNLDDHQQEYSTPAKDKHKHKN